MSNVSKPLAETVEAASYVSDEELAVMFHFTYERLAPQFGYITKPETQRFDPESPNGRLMIATVKVVRERLVNSELLAACEKALRCVENFPKSWGHEIDTIPTLKAAIAKARRASAQEGKK